MRYQKILLDLDEQNYVTIESRLLTHLDFVTVLQMFLLGDLMHYDASFYEINARLQGHEPGNTEAEVFTAFGVLPGDNWWRHSRQKN
jgi:hypothetical protein